MKVCDCHGEERDADRGCKEKRRARQRAYVQRRRDDFVVRATDMLRTRRYSALSRRAERAARG